LERSEVELKSAELNYIILTRSTTLPRGVLDSFLTTQVSPKETEYRDALAAVKDAYNPNNPSDKT
jgi:hypothetical protein